MNIALLFRSSDSGSSLTLTWENGEVSKDYNGRVAGRRWPLTERPVSAAEFEQWCRRAFGLGGHWTVRRAVGFDIAA